MTKRVYKFTSAKYGISNLQNERLKLSTVDDLNDPFDLCPLDTTDPVIKWAILCFSRNWDNLLLWRHYGDSHTESVWALLFLMAASARTVIPMSSINRICCKYAARKT